MLPWSGPTGGSDPAEAWPGGVEQYGEVFSEPMRAGDVMAFHNLTLHSTCPNERSDRVRWSIDLRYMRTGEGFAWHKLGDTFDVQ